MNNDKASTILSYFMDGTGDCLPALQIILQNFLHHGGGELSLICHLFTAQVLTRAK